MTTDTQVRTTGSDRPARQARHQRRRRAVRMALAMLGVGVVFAAPAAASTLIGTSQIRDKAVTAPKIATNAVTNAKIAPLAVTNSKIGAQAVSNSKISALAV